MIEIIIPSLLMNNLDVILICLGIAILLIMGTLIYRYDGNPAILVIGFFFLIAFSIIFLIKDGSPIQIVKISVGS